MCYDLEFVMTKNNGNEHILLPAVALRGLNVFPGMVIHFDLTRKKSIAAVRLAMRSGASLFAITQKDVNAGNPDMEDLYETGTVVNIRQITKLPGNVVRVLVEGQYRARLVGIDETNQKYIEASILPVDEDDGYIASSANHNEAAYRALIEVLSEYFVNHPKVSQNVLSQLKPSMKMQETVRIIVSNLPLLFDKKQQILDALSTKEQYEALYQILTAENEVASVQAQISKDIKEKVEKNQREYIMREQLAYLRKELDGDDELSEIDAFKEKVEVLEASKDIKDKIYKEINRLSKLSDSSSESAVSRGYIETLLELPWDKESEDNDDINNASRILDEDHYGLEKIKERILEFLAVRTLTKGNSSPILCLVGPPGTGKTSIAKSVARALEKKYVRICLGGVRDEAEIRGHRRTYIGAMPGRLVDGLRNAGVANPLMLLDEIDKVSNDYKGDTFSALLEVLDPDQNKAFRDHYVELPVDLSSVLFIATANDTQTIPRPLLDRMEVIRLSGYTENEKFHIAKEHLVKKQYKENGITTKMLRISDGALKDIIRYYTREAGVRGLEKQIAKLCRKAAKEMVASGKSDKISITGKNLSDFLGKRIYEPDSVNKKDEVGIVRGLAWTAVGGDTLQIEVNIMPGKGEIKLTGQMGDVMKESAYIALSYIRMVASSYGIASEVFTENDVHIHIPQGAVPKDGPSAGITMATAMLSAFSNKPVRSRVAMTGEITLRGKVLPIGGLKEKLLAARLAGIETVLVPKRNEKDILEIDAEVIGDMKVLYVEDMSEVAKAAIVGV